MSERVADGVEPTADPGEEIPPYRPHLGPSRQYWRDIVLGVNDGLVSMFLLVAGVVGGGMATHDILLATVAAAVAGAVSMAAGEYMATKSQEEVFDREMALEEEHFRYHRDREIEELREMLADLGLSGDTLEAAVAQIGGDDDALLKVMMALEFGVVEQERRSPILAMLASGALFLVGSLPSVLPFAFVTDAQTGFLLAALGSFLGLFLVGVAKTRATDGHPIVSGLENLLVAGAGAVASYAIGAAVGTVVP